MRLYTPALVLLVTLATALSLRAQSYEFTTIAGAVGVTDSTDGPAASARFFQPLGLVFDAAGALYISDSGNSTVRKLTPAGDVSTIAGVARSPGGIDGPAAVARFYIPWGLGFDLSGDLLITDNYSHTLRKFSAPGSVTTVVGRNLVTGSTDGQDPLVRFDGPAYLVIDRAGNVFISDYKNHTIRKLTPAGVVSTFAGSPGLLGSTNGTGTAARFAYPTGLAVDAEDNLFVADSGSNLIRKITSAGVVSTFAGSPGTTGATDGTGSAARFSAPNGLAIDASGSLYVTEFTNHTIRKITSAGVVSTLGGLAGTAGSADGTGNGARFNKPYGIAIDRNGTLFIADTFNHTLRKGVVALPPVIITAPRPLVVSNGGTTALAVAATGGSNLAYQWKKNGLPIPGATTSTYVFPGQTLSAGGYTVDVTNGSGTTTSAVATVSVVDSPNPGRISNLAIRSSAGTDAQTLIVGTVLGGAGTVGSKPLLLRGVGPTLATFGVTGALADPVMNVFNNTGRIADNDDWAGSFDFASVGAFNFTGTTPKDAALYSGTTALGSYSIQVSGKNGTTGTALAEIYDATPGASFTATTPRLINVSARTQVGTGGDILIAGFTISGATAKTVLIRAAGPALAAFGVTGALVNPSLELFSGPTRLFANDDWSGDTVISSAGASVGAFPFTVPTSKDAALLVTLAPGGYTVQVSGVAATTGVALIEIYEVP